MCRIRVRGSRRVRSCRCDYISSNIIRSRIRIGIRRHNVIRRSMSVMFGRVRMVRCRCHRGSRRCSRVVCSMISSGSRRIGISSS